MSLNLQMTKAVWLSALPKGVNKLVLLAMCHHFNDSQQLSWPSVSRLALMCGMSERTVQNHLRVLQRVGILVPRMVRTGFSTRYAIELKELLLIVFPKASTSPFGQPLDDQPVDNSCLISAESAPPFTEIGTTPPQISTDTPAESAPELSLTLQSTVKGTAAPALPASALMIDSVNPKVLADFAAIRKAKRKGAVTAEVIEEICRQAHLAGMTLEQALQHCCHPDRKWARFEASWMQGNPGGNSNAATVTTPTPAAALWKPPVSKPATPEVRAAEMQRQRQICQTPSEPVAGIQLGRPGPGWAHAIVRKYESGQPVSKTSLREACLALKITPASLFPANTH